MDKQIVFSIIMPCYNSEAYVRTAIDSVLMQTYENWELIAVNDGSNDNTLSILQSYEKTDPRIRLFSKENGGYVSAVNYGLDHIEGDYFLFLGSDDRLSPDLFRTICDMIPDENPDLIGFQTMMHRQTEDETDPQTSFDSFAVSYNTNITIYQEKYPKESAIFFTRDTAKCYKRTLLNDIRYYGKYGVDADGIFAIKLARRASSFMSVPVVGYHWTLRDDSVSGRPASNPVYLDRIGNWIDFYRYILSLGIKRLSSPEILYISYFTEILRFCYSVKEIRRRHKETVKAGIAVVKQVSEKYSVPIEGSNRLFLISPAAWYCLYTVRCRINKTFAQFEMKKKALKRFVRRGKRWLRNRKKH